ncbi:MAG: HTTM domain-containing protein [Myxococcales bacterium]|nr:HTTM domain-containing protein [Myxococcales bacterium]
MSTSLAQRWADRWHRWVTYWAVQEHPRSLALVRICLGLVILWEFMEIFRLDLVVALFGSQDVGGLSDALSRAKPPLVYRVLPGTVESAKLLHAIPTVAAFMFTCGLFTRTSALVLLLSWAQFAHILPAADRGIDTLCRDVLWIFTFAPAGACWSADALIRSGKWEGDGALVGAWARRLIILQLVVMYFMAGVQKTGVHWYPMGHFAALYFILLDPAIGRYDFTFLANQPFFFFTQLGTAGTILFQDSYPLVLLWIHYRNTPDRPGRLRAFANRWHLDWVWIVTGGVFHLLLALTMELGIFPWAMLALYPAWLRPQDLKRVMDRVGQWVRPAR